MNPGICYLYEYENNQRKRNVGFLKIARHYQSCVLQIHARGIRAGNGAALELYAFYLDDGRMIASQIASLTCFSHMISIRLPVTESHFPEGRSLQQIDGFLLRFPADGMPVFWMASTAFFDVNLAKMQSPEEAAAPEASEPSVSDVNEMAPDFSSDSEPDISPEVTDISPEVTDIPGDQSAEDNASSSDNNTPPSDNRPWSSSEENIFPDDSAPDNSSAADSHTQPGITPPPQGNSSSMEENPISPSMEGDTEANNPSSIDGANETDRSEPPEDPISMQEETSAVQQDSASRGSQPASEPTARKITRRDISLLPRKYWFLANNSFLLHGYHNYSHLLLVEENGHLWLGVPGIYDPREARAADLFGFPQFTREYAPLLDLSEDERNDSADFGHWCRYISQRESGSDDSRSRSAK